MVYFIVLIYIYPLESKKTSLYIVIVGLRANGIILMGIP